MKGSETNYFGEDSGQKFKKPRSRSNRTYKLKTLYENFKKQRHRSETDRNINVKNIKHNNVEVVSNINKKRKSLKDLIKKTNLQVQLNRKLFDGKNLRNLDINSLMTSSTELLIYCRNQLYEIDLLMENVGNSFLENRNKLNELQKMNTLIWNQTFDSIDMHLHEFNDGILVKNEDETRNKLRQHVPTDSSYNFNNDASFKLNEFYDKF